MGKGTREHLPGEHRLGDRGAPLLWDARLLAPLGVFLPASMQIQFSVEQDRSILHSFGESSSSIEVVSAVQLVLKEMSTLFLFSSSFTKSVYEASILRNVKKLLDCTSY